METISIPDLAALLSRLAPSPFAVWRWAGVYLEICERDRHQEDFDRAWRDINRVDRLAASRSSEAENQVAAALRSFLVREATRHDDAIRFLSRSLACRPDICRALADVPRAWVQLPADEPAEEGVKEP
jgi:predicted ATPase